MSFNFKAHGTQDKQTTYINKNRENCFAYQDFGSAE
jgi:hypothetical protein